MIEDKRIEWCKLHCIDNDGNSYIGNMNFNDQEFIEINTDTNCWLTLIFDEEKLPDFIKFKVKGTSIKRVNIDLEKCPHLKSWKGLPTEKVNPVWFGSELENVDSMTMCGSIDYSFIKNKTEKHQANKRLRIKQWQKFQSEVLIKLQEQNSEINISDYADGIEWLAIHDKYFYKKYLEKKLLFDDGKISFNEWTVFESIVNPLPIKIQNNLGIKLDLYIDDDFNYSDGEKLMNNISSEKDIFLPNQEDWISDDDFLRLAEEKTNQNIIESKTVNKKSIKNK